MMQVGNLAWPSLNANWAQIFRKFHETLFESLRLEIVVSPNFQPSQVWLRLSYLDVVLFYNFDYLEQYLRECFSMASGFHWETIKPISGSHVFFCLYDLVKVPRLLFYHLKNINQITQTQETVNQCIGEQFYSKFL